MKRFKKVYVEITNICNLSCSFCPKNQRPGQFMKQELFEKILEELKGYARYLYFHVMGEPFLHPNIPLFLDLCHLYGYRVNITTNGTLIDRVMDSILGKPALRQVNLSLHSFEADNASCSMDDYLDKIFNFISKADETDLLICLRLWNLAEVGTAETNGYVLRRIEKALSLDYKLEEKLTPCRGIKLGKNIFLNQALSFQWPDIKDSLEGETGFCMGLRDQIGILVDGTVIPCCLDREGVINLGNIKNEHFSDIIESSRAKKIYDTFSNRKVAEPLCQRCRYRKRFDL